jgi:hypothetical protein
VYRVKANAVSYVSAIFINVHTSRPDVEHYGINATYSLKAQITQGAGGAG